MSSTLTLPVMDEKGKSTAQVAGSVITYLRRYALASVLGIYADEDTDGHTDSKKPEPKKAEPVAPPASLMTLEMAQSETNRDGVKYADLETSTLANMANTLAKKLKDNNLTPEEREDKQRKLDACRVILASRQA